MPEKLSTKSDPSHVLRRAGDLMRESSRYRRDPILDLENAVYSCWSFQIDVARDPKSYLHYQEAQLSEEDLVKSRLPGAGVRLSPRAVFLFENVHRYGPGSGHFDSRRGWVTSYRFTPTMNGGAASFIVGDIAANVLAWRLQPPDGAKYAKSTLTGPDPRSWTRWLKVEAWNREKPQLLPEEARLDPTSAIDYVRTIPLFTDALRAVLELDASPPEACTTDKAVDLVRGDPWTPDPAIVANLSLMASQQVIPSDPKIFPPRPERPNGISHALQLSGDD